MRGKLGVLCLIAVFSTIFMVNLMINLNSNVEIYGSTLELDNKGIDHFLLDDINNLSLRTMMTSPNTLVGNKYFSLCWRGNDSVLHEADFNTDLSDINNFQETVLPFLKEYSPSYHLASNGSCFWTLDLDLNLICFTKQGLMSVSTINVNHSIIDYIFPIFSIRYWDENLYVLGQNFTETNDKYYYIAKLNLITLKYDFIIEDNEILTKKNSVVYASYGFDIDEQGNLWIASELRKITENGFRSVGIEIYTYNMTQHNILSRIRLDKSGLENWIPANMFEEKWFDKYPSIFPFFDGGSISIAGNFTKIIFPFTAAVYNGEEWLYQAFGGLTIFSLKESPFPFTEVLIWGGGIFLPVIAIIIIIRDSKMTFKKG